VVPARLVDVDGNDHIDFAYNGMSLIHGHALGPVAEVLTQSVRQAWAWPGSNLPQIEFAEMPRASDVHKS
jgi:glutamate-1-semialdehyde aminotransferase